MSVMILENSAPAIWERAVEPRKANLTPAAARALLRLRLSNVDLDRADELAAKARIGRLIPTEERELEDYRTVATALEFLRSKARLRLRPARRNGRQT